MRNFLLISLALCLLSPAAPAAAANRSSHAAPKGQGSELVRSTKALLKRLKAHRPKQKPIHALDTPILAFLPSPSSPTQGQSLTMVMESINRFSGRILSIDYSLNGGAVGSAPLIGDATLFAATLGTQTLAGANFLDATLYLENAADNLTIRNAIKTLDTNINHLTTQINAERDPLNRAQLQEQRSEQIALKAELVTELRAYRVAVGTQRFNYTIGADSSSPTQPKVTAVSPSSGDVRGGTKVTFSGQNFSSSFTVSFGGVAAPAVTYVNANTVYAYTPDMGLQTGSKDIEIRFTANGSVSNVLIPGGYFATNVVPSAPSKPVAIASGSQHIRLSETAQLDGTQSYANRVATLGYNWTVVSAPANSNYTPGQNLGSATTLSVTPSSVGAYVFSLVVRETDTAEHLVSDPSIVEVLVGNAPQPVAPSITLQRGTSANSQVIANDPSIGTSEIYAISQAPIHGTASINNAGLATYVAGPNFVGADPFTVTVTNQVGQSGAIVIPVLVVEFNHGPAPTAPSITSHTEPRSSQVSPNDPNQGLTYSYSVVVQPQHGIASVDANGLSSFASAAGFTGSDKYIVEVTNSETPPQAAIVDVNVTVLANTQPQISAPNIATSAGHSATSQAAVTDDAGQIGSYSISTPPSNGTATISASGLVTYTANSSFDGSETFVISYTDNGNPALTGSATITASVVGPPSASAPAITVANGGSATSAITVTSSTSGRSYSFAVSQAPAHGTASVNVAGLVTFNPTAPYTGSDSLAVTVTDANSPSLFTTVTIPVTITPNHAPTGSAPTISVNGFGSGTSQVTPSDQDSGQSFTYAISTQPSLGSASISSSGLVSYTANVGYASSDSVVVTVTDNGTPQLSGTVTVPVTINGPTNQPPVIPNPLFFRILTRGVPYQVGLSLSGVATPSGGITAPNGSIKSIVWDFGDGTHEGITDALQATNNHNYTSTGNFTANLTVTDNLNAVSTRSLQVAIVDTDIPVAKFTISPTNGNTLNTPITLNASASSDSDGIVQYRWLLCGVQPEIVTTSASITHTFTTGGNCSIRLRVRDHFTAEGQSSVTLPISSNNASGVASQAKFLVGPPREVVLGSNHTFDGSLAFNPNIGGTITAWNWNFNDVVSCPSNPNKGCAAAGLNVIHGYTAAGNYAPNLIVTNGLGIQSPSLFNEVFAVNATGHAPHALFSAAPTGLSVSFDGTASYAYPPANLQTFSWNYGDGSSSGTTSTSTHTYSAAGSYLVILAISDSDGNKHSLTQTITVSGSRDQKATPRDGASDPDREYQRQLLAGACATDNAEACAQLADMYAEDGDAVTAENLKARACSMGYQNACTKHGRE
jgi:PKD repeat protein